MTHCTLSFLPHRLTRLLRARMVAQLSYALLWQVLLLFGGYASLSAQHLDENVFGDTLSEKKHGLTSYDLSKAEVYTGQAGQKARRFLPNAQNPYQGNYPGIYGGEVSFIMKVDSTKQNYFTVKLAGNEKNEGRILLNVEGKEVGGRHGGERELFMDATEQDNPISPGAFFYRTVPIPRTLTNNKTQVTVRLRSTGPFFAYGSPFVYGTYQRALEKPTMGVYKAYMHTNPAFALPTEDLQGNTPSYASAPTNGTNNLTQIKANLIANIENKVSALLNGDSYLQVDYNSYYNDIEAMAVAYEMPYNAVAYHNPAVITWIRKAVDQLVRKVNNGSQGPGDCWGGCFGRAAYGVSLVYNQLTGLDEVVDLGGAAGLTRRQQWSTIFKASFDAGATYRKIITAQELDNGMGVYSASLGLAKLDPVKYGSLPQVGIHHMLEACGIEECTGPMTNLATNPTLGTPATGINGPGFYFMTQKGTSHEPSWVSPDCYGNLAPRLIELWHMTKHDPHVTAYGVGAGDQRILDKAMAHNHTQTSFTYPWTQDGKKCILAEGCICGRNKSLPGKMHYGSPLVAAISHDAAALGYMRQMIDDGWFSSFESENPSITATQYLPDAIDQLAASASNTKIPSTPGQPDYVSADEENGIATIKKGDEMVFIDFYTGSTTDNKRTRAHYITPLNERKIELSPDKVEYYASGAFTVAEDNVSGGWSGDAPDKPVGAYVGEVQAYPSYNRSSAHDPRRGLLDFYQVRYGKYLIAMNTTTDLTKTITVPADMVGKSGYDVATRSNVTLSSTLSLPPRTTKVYYVGDVAEQPGLLADNSPTPSGVNKTTLNTNIATIEAFATNASTVAKVSIDPFSENYRYNLFDVLIRQLAVAKYRQQSTKATQVQVDQANAQLVAAYNALIGNKYPVLNPYQRVEVENYTSQSGVQTEATGDVDGNLNLSWVDPGDWTSYIGYDFKTKGATKFYVRYTMPSQAAATLEVHLDDRNGPLVGTCTLQPTASWQTWKTDSCIIGLDVVGKKTFALVYKGGMNVNWVRFDSTDRTGSNQTVTFSPIGNKTTASADVTLQASATSGLPITYTSSNSAIALISGTKLRILGTGTVTISATQPGNNTYNPARSTQTITVTAATVSAPYKANQVPGIFEGEDYDYGGEGVAFHSTGAGDNPYRPGDKIETEGAPNSTLQSNGYNLSYVYGTEWMQYTLNVTNAGTYTAGLRYAYNAAASVTRDFTISIDGAVYGTYSVPSTNSWANYVTYAFPITFATSGSHVLRIKLGGPASQGTFNLDRLSINLGQSLTFPSITSKTLNSADFDPGATASSGLVVSYSSSNPAVATIVNGKVHIVSVGSAIITASQAGTATYAQATPVSQTLTVTGTIGNPYQRLEAENYNQQSGVETETTQDAGGGLNLSWVNAGDWTSYSAYNFKTKGATKFSVRYAIPSTATTLEVHLNDKDGPLVGTCTLQPTGAWQTWKTDSCMITTGLQGVKTFALVYKGSINVNWVRFDSTDRSTTSQTITFPSIAVKELNSADFNPGATASSGLAVSYTSSNLAVASIVNGKVHIVGVGSTTITASQPGDFIYAAATPVSQVLTVITAFGNPYQRVEAENFTSQNGVQTEATGDVDGNRNLSFVDAGDWTSYIGYDFKAKGATKFSVRYSIPSQATTLEVHLNGKDGPLVGTCNLPATGAWQNWRTDSCVINVGLQEVQTFTLVYKGSMNVNWARFDSTDRGTTSQTLTFPPIGEKKLNDSDFNPGATASSGLLVRYTSSNPAVATIVNGKVHIMGIGSTTITASQAGNSTYAEASSGSQSLTVIFGNPYQRVEVENYTSQDGVQIQPSSDEGGGSSLDWVDAGDWTSYSSYDFKAKGAIKFYVRYGIQSTATTLEVHLNGKDGPLVGTCNLPSTGSWHAWQTDSCVINVGLQEVQTFTLVYRGGINVNWVRFDSASYLQQTLIFPPIGEKNLGDSDFDAGATASSGIPITYSSSDPTVATMVNGTIHLVGAGTTTITASQPGNAIYSAAASVNQILSVNKKAQTISFPGLATKQVWDADFTPGATASSGLALSYSSSNPAVATIVNGLIRLVKGGTAVITASQLGNESYNAAPAVSQTLTVSAALSVQYQDGDGGQLSNNAARPYLKLTNEGTIAVPYSELTARYWFTAENYAGISTWIDYAQLGSSKVTSQYVALAQPRSGALGYIEYRFMATAGNLAANGNSGPIQSRFANSDWANLNEGDDYSYQSFTSYAISDRITLYRNGKLIWGNEPALASPVTNLKVYTESKNSAANIISTYLKVHNEGNVPVSYQDLSVRYWFTSEGNSALKYWIDYAKLGSANLTGQLVAVSPVVSGANTYLEWKFKPAAGMLYSLSSTGNIQYRITKANWSNFIQADDYSYLSVAPFAANPHVTLYYQGQLVYGSEPSSPGARTASTEDNTSLQVTVLGNPVSGDKAAVEIRGGEGQRMSLQLVDAKGNQLVHRMIEKASETERLSIPLGKSTGLYLLRVSTPTQSAIVKIVKQ